MHSRAVRVDGDLRRTLWFAGLANRLADDEPPALETRMLASGGHIAFDAG
jgi:hypothetical protein